MRVVKQKKRKIWELITNNLTLYLNGGIVDGKMVLENKEKTEKGILQNRITWIPNEDGTVRQIWETKTEKQEKWQKAFDGDYKKY